MTKGFARCFDISQNVEVYTSIIYKLKTSLMLCGLLPYSKEILRSDKI